MLVAICALRKFMECVFSRHELRVLDDLLPESGRDTKRRHANIFNRMHSKYAF